MAAMGDEADLRSQGLLTCVVAVFSYLWLPISPVETKTFIVRKGWFSEREEIIAVNVGREAFPVIFYSPALVANPPRRPCQGIVICQERHQMEGHQGGLD